MDGREGVTLGGNVITTSLSLGFMGANDRLITWPDIHDNNPDSRLSFFPNLFVCNLLTIFKF